MSEPVDEHDVTDGHQFTFSSVTSRGKNCSHPLLPLRFSSPSASLRWVSKLLRAPSPPSSRPASECCCLAVRLTVSGSQTVGLGACARRTSPVPAARVLQPYFSYSNPPSPPPPTRCLLSPPSLSVVPPGQCRQAGRPPFRLWVQAGGQGHGLQPQAAGAGGMCVPTHRCL